MNNKKASYNSAGYEKQCCGKIDTSPLEAARILAYHPVASQPVVPVRSSTIHTFKPPAAGLLKGLDQVLRPQLVIFISSPATGCRSTCACVCACVVARERGRCSSELQNNPTTGRYIHRSEYWHWVGHHHLHKQMVLKKGIATATAVAAGAEQQQRNAHVYRRGQQQRFPDMF